MDRVKQVAAQQVLLPMRWGFHLYTIYRGPGAGVERVCENSGGPWHSFTVSELTVFLIPSLEALHECKP